MTKKNLATEPHEMLKEIAEGKDERRKLHDQTIGSFDGNFDD